MNKIITYIHELIHVIFIKILIKDLRSDTFCYVKSKNGKKLAIINYTNEEFVAIKIEVTKFEKFVILLSPYFFGLFLSLLALIQILILSNLILSLIIFIILNFFSYKFIISSLSDLEYVTDKELQFIFPYTNKNYTKLF